MLVPQHTQQCQQCGRLPAIPATVCPSCETRLSPTWTPHHSHSAFFPFPPMPSPPNMTPLLVEILLNCIGLYGVGWLLAGKTRVGVPLLMGSCLLWPLVVVIGLLTLGLGFLCLAPLLPGAIICNGFLLRHAITQKHSLTSLITW